MPVVSNACLGCGLGVDDNGLPAVMYGDGIACTNGRVHAVPKPGGNIGVDANGIFELCQQNYLGVVGVGFNNASGIAIAVPANTDTFINGGAALATRTVTNTSTTCSMRIRTVGSVTVQGINVAPNTQSAPSRIEAQTRINAGAWNIGADVSPFLQTCTAPNGWQSNPGMLNGGATVAVLGPGASYTFAVRALVRSTVACTVVAWAAGVRIEGWVIS